MNWILDVLYFLNPRDTASLYVMWGILTLLAELSTGNSHPVCASVCVYVRVSVCVYIYIYIFFLYGLIIASIILSAAVELIQL